MRKFVIGLCVTLLITFPAPVSITAAAINQHYNCEVATVNDIKALAPSEIVALYPMPEELEAEIIHVEPECRVNIDSVWYEPADITLFNGQRLHFIHNKSGNLYAFTDVYIMELFIEQEYGFSFHRAAADISHQVLSDNSMLYEDWLFGGRILSTVPYGAYPDLTSLGWNDCISSARIGSAPLTLWGDSYYQGDSFTMMPFSDHSVLALEGWNDRASSIS